MWSILLRMMMTLERFERTLGSSQKMDDLKFVEGDVEGLRKTCFRDGS